MFLIIKDIIKKIFFKENGFTNSKDYWNTRYLKGGNSGMGSYGRLAQFKAEVINDFIKYAKIESVIEFGCGDGNQLKYMKYPLYLGFDVSQVAIENCKIIFKEDKSKKFQLVPEYKGEQADLVLSLEVIFHLIEDDVFQNYMERLFSSSKRYVIIYSSNTIENKVGQSPHVKHRKFTQWIIENNVPFQLVNKIDNRFPYDGSNETSFSDFYFFEKNFSKQLDAGEE